MIIYVGIMLIIKLFAGEFGFQVKKCFILIDVANVEYH